MKRLFFIVLIIFAATFAYYYLGTDKSKVVAQEKPAAQPAIPVSAAKVIANKVIEFDEFSGKFEAVERAEIRSRVSGTIDEVLFKDGEIVKKGQSLFTIDPRPYQATLERARAELSSAQTRLDLAEKEYERAEKLMVNGTITQREHDERANNVNVAKSNIKVAEAGVSQASLDVEYAHIKAPISGRISRAELTVGNTVSSTNQVLLATIVSIDPIYASFDADEKNFLKYFKASGSDTDNLKKIPVYVGLSSNDEPNLQAHIHSFDNEINSGSGTIRVRAIVDNPDGSLVPGLFAKIKVGGEGARSAIMVNERAIGTDQNKKFVFVVNPENKIEYREVKLGGIVDGLRVIDEGLKEDEKIVVVGLQKVRPDALVAPQDVSMKTLEPEDAIEKNIIDPSKL